MSSALAVFILMTNATFVDCSTGRRQAFAFEDAIRIVGCASVLIGGIGPERNQPAFAGPANSLMPRSISLALSEFTPQGIPPPPAVPASLAP